MEMDIDLLANRVIVFVVVRAWPVQQVNIAQAVPYSPQSLVMLIDPILIDSFWLFSPHQSS